MFEIENPNRPDWARKAANRSWDDIVVVSVVGAIIGSLVAFFVGMIPDALGVGGLGLEDAGPAWTEWAFGTFVAAFAVARGLGQTAIKLADQFIYPPITFDSHYHCNAYTSFFELTPDEQSEARLAYEALQETPADDPQLRTVYNTYDQTLTALAKQRKILAVPVTNVKHEEALEHLKWLNKTNQQLKESSNG